MQPLPNLGVPAILFLGCFEYHQYSRKHSGGLERKNAPREACSVRTYRLDPSIAGVRGPVPGAADQMWGAGALRAR